MEKKTEREELTYEVVSFDKRFEHISNELTSIHTAIDFLANYLIMESEDNKGVGIGCILETLLDRYMNVADDVDSFHMEVLALFKKDDGFLQALELAKNGGVAKEEVTCK